tara:strand:- start:3420 stop:6089 length:2670 start_codon:yes stop_codon:yes gene_type:complete
MNWGDILKVEEKRTLGTPLKDNNNARAKFLMNLQRNIDGKPNVMEEALGAVSLDTPPSSRKRSQTKPKISENDKTILVKLKRKIKIYAPIESRFFTNKDNFSARRDSQGTTSYGRKDLQSAALFLKMLSITPKETSNKVTQTRTQSMGLKALDESKIKEKLGNTNTKLLQSKLDIEVKRYNTVIKAIARIRNSIEKMNKKIETLPELPTIEKKKKETAKETKLREKSEERKEDRQQIFSEIKQIKTELTKYMKEISKMKKVKKTYVGLEGYTKDNEGKKTKRRLTVEQAIAEYKKKINNIKTSSFNNEVKSEVEKFEKLKSQAKEYEKQMKISNENNIEEKYKKTMSEIYSMYEQYGVNLEEESIETKKDKITDDTMSTYFKDKKKLNLLTVSTYLKGNKIKNGRIERNIFFMKDGVIKELITDLKNLPTSKLRLPFLSKSYIDNGKEITNELYNSNFSTPYKAVESTVDILTILGGKNTYDVPMDEKNAKAQKKYSKTTENNKKIRTLLNNWSSASSSDDENVLIGLLEESEKTGIFQPMTVRKINEMLFQGKHGNMMEKKLHPFIEFSTSENRDINTKWNDEKEDWGFYEAEDDSDDKDWISKLKMYNGETSKKIWLDIVNTQNLSEDGISSNSSAKGGRKAERTFKIILTDFIKLLDRLNSKDRNVVIAPVNDLKTRLLQVKSLNVESKKDELNKLKEEVNNTSSLITKMYAFMNVYERTIEMLIELEEIDFTSSEIVEDKNIWSIENQIKLKNNELINYVKPTEFLYQLLLSLGKTSEIESNDTFKLIENRKIPATASDVKEELEEAGSDEFPIVDEVEDTEEILTNIQFVRNSKIEEAIKYLNSLDLSDTPVENKIDKEISKSEELAKALRKVNRKKVILSGLL